MRGAVNLFYFMRAAELSFESGKQQECRFLAEFIYPNISWEIKYILSTQCVTLTFYAKKCRILQTEYSWSYGTEGS